MSELNPWEQLGHQMYGRWWQGVAYLIKQVFSESQEWYLKTAEVAFNIGGIALGAKGVQTILTEDMSEGALLGVAGVATCLVGSFHGHLDDRRVLQTLPEQP